MPPIKEGDVVVSLSGRDRGRLFFVLSCDEKTVTLADGRLRRVSRPKRNNRRHVAQSAYESPVVREHLSSGAPLTDAVLRKTLSALTDGPTP